MGPLRDCDLYYSDEVNGIIQLDFYKTFELNLKHINLA